MTGSRALNRAQIVAALQALDRACAARGILGEICIYGGAQMVLVFDARPSTRDVDAVFRPATELREAAREVAAELELPSDWLNDGVKGFVSDREATRAFVVPEWVALTHLRLVWPTARYLLAMKCLAARVDEGAPDRADAALLIDRLGFTTVEEVLRCIEQFYPAERIQVKSRYFIEELMATRFLPAPERGSSS